jgi:hypothetical protein
MKTVEHTSNDPTDLQEMEVRPGSLQWQLEEILGRPPEEVEQPESWLKIEPPHHNK